MERQQRKAKYRYTKNCQLTLRSLNEDSGTSWHSTYQLDEY